MLSNSQISSLALLPPPPPPCLPPSQLDSTSAAAQGLSRSTSDLCKDVTLLHVSLGLSRPTSDLCRNVTLLHVFEIAGLADAREVPWGSLLELLDLTFRQCALSPPARAKVHLPTSFLAALASVVSGRRLLSFLAFSSVWFEFCWI